MERKGFTILELIVAVSLFSILAVLAGGSFVAALSLQRRALNIKKVEENGRYVLELMSREIRVANPINTGNTGCSPGVSTLSFQHPVSGLVQYSLVGTEIERTVSNALSKISNPDVEVIRLNFCVSGNSANDDKQPRVTIFLTVKAGGDSREVSTIDLQTTVSQRVLSD